MNRRRSKEATSQTWLPTTQQSHPFSAPDHPSRGAATTRKRKPQTTDSDNRGALPRLVVGNSAPTSSWDIRDRLQKVTSAREIPTPPPPFRQRRARRSCRSRAGVVCCGVGLPSNNAGVGPVFLAKCKPLRPAHLNRRTNPAILFTHRAMEEEEMQQRVGCADFTEDPPIPTLLSHLGSLPSCRRKGACILPRPSINCSMLYLLIQKGRLSKLVPF